MNDTEVQQKLLYLLLNYQDLIPQFLANDFSAEYFDSKYKTLIHSIEFANHVNTKVTQEYYIDFVGKSVSNGDYKKWSGSEVTSIKIATLNEKAIFDLLLNLDKVDVADFDLISRKLKEIYVKRKSLEYFEKFNQKKTNDYVGALSSFSEDISLLVTNNANSKIATFTTVDEYGEEWFKNLEEEITNPRKVLQTGIAPFDETMPMGLDVGSLTLVVADVGGFKSATMMNIALNVCKIYKENVLYVSLEMPRQSLMHRIMAREAGVDSEKINKPNLLTEAEKEKLKKAYMEFKNISPKFAILDAQERMTVSKIRAEIEKQKATFRPRLVVVDYVSILVPDNWYQKLAEHSWYGQMCKDLRQLGRKMGFAVLTAVQLNREAIKSLRSQKDGKQTVGSDALRGSHDFSADADNIYAQFPHPDMPKEKLYLFCIKSRNGSTMFGPYRNQNKATLEVHANISKISACVDAVWNVASDNSEASEFLRKAENIQMGSNDLELSFNSNDTVKKKRAPKVVNNDLGFEL
jgi:replicative DNA helicase